MSLSNHMLDDDKSDWTEADHQLELKYKDAEKCTAKYFEKMMKSAQRKGIPSGMMAMTLYDQAVAWAILNGWSHDGVKDRVDILIEETDDPRFLERRDLWRYAMTNFNGQSNVYRQAQTTSAS